ncbi:MAG: hypothetical protein FWG87_05120 [Defluviitaleaceae bacterium]|nr:hypothetical protein [Defluviitaleaceae bacterium]
MYLVLFGVGAGFILLSLILGDLLDFDLDLDFDGASVFGLLRPMLIAVFMVVSGGLGLLLTPYFEWSGGGGIVLFISLVGGLGTAGLVNRFVIVPLNRAQNTSAFNIQDTVGTSAKVISPIPQGGYGKIQYSISGSLVTSPAKSEDGNPISNGENVEIIYIEKNTYFVRHSSK